MRRYFINDDIVKSENFRNFIKVTNNYKTIVYEDNDQYYIKIDNDKNKDKIVPKYSDYIADIVFSRRLSTFNPNFFSFDELDIEIKKVILSKKVKNKTVEYTRDI